MAKKFRIIIETEGDVRGAQKVAKALNQVEGAADSAFDALRLGTGISIGDRLVDQITRIPDAMARAAARGIEFNKTVQDGTTKLETMLGSAGAAREKVADLTEFAAKTPFQLPGLLQATIILESLTQGALSGRDGLKLLGDAAAKSGQPIEEVAVHLGRLFSGLQSGRAVGESLARFQEIGLLMPEVRSEIEKLQKEGKKGEKVWSLLSAELEKNEGQMEKLSDTYTGRLSTLQDTLDNALGRFSKPFFDGLADGFKTLTESVGQEDFAQTLEQIGFEVARLVERGVALTDFAVKNADALAFLARVAKVYGSALIALKLKDLLLWMGRKTIAVKGSTTALQAETAAVVANSAAHRANAASRMAGAAAAARGAGSRFLALGGGPVGVGLVGGFAAQEIINAAGSRIAARAARAEILSRQASDEGDAIAAQVKAMRTAEDLERVRLDIVSRRLKLQEALGRALEREDEVAAKTAENRLRSLARWSRALQDILARMQAIGEQERIQAADEARRAKELAAAQADVRTVVQGAKGVREELDRLRFESLPPEDQLKELERRRREAEARPTAVVLPGNEVIPTEELKEQLRARIELKERDLLLIEQQIEATKELIEEERKQRAEHAADDALSERATRRERERVDLEISAMQARLDGRDREASAMERRIALMGETDALVSRLNVSEAEALRIAERRLSLQERLAGGASNATLKARAAAEALDETRRGRRRSRRKHLDAAGDPIDFAALEVDRQRRHAVARGDVEALSLLPQIPAFPSQRERFDQAAADFQGRFGASAAPTTGRNGAAEAAESDVKSAGEKLGRAVEKVGAATVDQFNRIEGRLNEILARMGELEN